MKKQINLVNDPIKRLFLHYLFPSISATLVTSIYILADTIFIGQGVGGKGIAALNIILPMFSLFFGIGLLFGVGGAVLMSISLGQGDTKTGQSYFTISFFLNLIISIVLLLVFITNFESIMYLFGATEEIMPLVIEYGIPFVIATPLFMFSALLQAFVRNDKAPKTAMAGVIIGGISNIILDYLFVFVFNMGMFGASFATILGTIISLVIFTTHFFKKNNNLKFVFDFSMKKFTRIITTGFSSFLIEVSNGVVICLFNIQLVSLVGNIGITAYGILSNSALVAMSLSNGIAQAAQPIISTNFGANRHNRISSVAKMGILACGVIGLLGMAIGELFPEAITAAFVNPTPEILTISIPAVKIYFISFLILPINIFATTYFQSVMKPKFSFTITLLRGLIICSVLVLILPKLFGLTGIWAVIPITELATLFIIFALIKRTKSKSN